MRRVADLALLEKNGGRLQPAGTPWTVEITPGERRRRVISGVADNQKPWRFETNAEGTLRLMKLWRGDVDGNGREDLLIGTIENNCGRCVDGAQATVLLFQRDGRPLPWTFKTHYGYTHEDLAVQPFLTDLDRNGRAELIQVSCEYGDNMSEVRTILGVNEARDGRMVVAEEIDTRAAEQSADGAKLSARSHWTDQYRGLESGATLHIVELIAREKNCCIVCIAFRDGQAIIDDPCEGKRENRILYSDGVTRIGWPNLIWDSLEGRRIVIGEDRSALGRLTLLKADVKLLGDPKRPEWLWIQTSTR